MYHSQNYIITTTSILMEILEIILYLFFKLKRHYYHPHLLNSFACSLICQNDETSLQFIVISYPHVLNIRDSVPCIFLALDFVDFFELHKKMFHNND
jgi:hypothetical protein